VLAARRGAAAHAVDLDATVEQARLTASRVRFGGHGGVAGMANIVTLTSAPSPLMLMMAEAAAAAVATRQRRRRWPLPASAFL